ncbi:hypothetical protein MTO96_041415 [Rhipicephalus appendiculatus]
MVERVVTVESFVHRNTYRLKGVCLAVDLRYEPATGEPVPELGTQLSSALVRLPTNTEGAIPRLWEVRQAMDELKNSPDPVVLYGAANILFTLLPCRLAHWSVY